jgi:hypothetical protein
MARYARQDGRLIPITKRGEARKGATFQTVGSAKGLNRGPRPRPKVALPKTAPIGRSDVPSIKPAPRAKRRKGFMQDAPELAPACGCGGACAVVAGAGGSTGTTPAQEPAPLPAEPSRLCGYCKKPVPVTKRAGTQFCSSKCKALAHYHKLHPEATFHPKA